MDSGSTLPNLSRSANSPDVMFPAAKVDEGGVSANRGRPWPREWEGPAASAVGGMSEAKSGDPAPSAAFVSPADFDSDYWRSVEGHRTLFGRDTAETRRQKLKGR